MTVSTEKKEQGNRAAAYLAAALAFLSCVCAGAEGAPPPPPGDDPASILTAGKAALEDGRYDLAQKQFTLYLEKKDGVSRENEEAVVLLVRSLYQQKKFAEILETLKPKRGKAPENGAFTYWRAFALHQMGRNDDALGELNDFEKKFKPDQYAGRVERLRAWCYLRSGKTDLALETFAKFDQEHGDSSEGLDNLLEWAKALMAGGKPEQAREILTRLAKQQANLPAVQEGCYWLGHMLVQEMKWDEAIGVITSLCANAGAKDDLRAESWYLLGRAQETRTNRTAAVEAFSNGVVLARSPEIKRKGGFELGRALIDNGRFEEGIVLLKAFVSAMPSDPLSDAAQLKVAATLLERGKYQQAVDEYQHYLETFTNSTGQAQAQQGMGWGLMNVGRYAEAATAFTKAYALFAQPADKEKCLFKAGDAYFANAQYKLAAETYRRFLAEFPESPNSQKCFFQLGESLARGGEKAKAEETFLELAGKHPVGVIAEEAMLRIAELKAEQGKWGDAVESFNKMLAACSNSTFAAEALKARGLAFYNLYKFNDALEDFDRVIHDYTNSAAVEESFYWRGMCWYAVGRDEEAVSSSTNFLRTYPDSKWAPKALFWVGNYYYNQGRYDLAETNFLRFAEKYGNNPMADDSMLWAGRAAAKRKEYVRSVEILTRMIKEGRSGKIAEARFSQADALRELQKDAEAILIYEEIINKYPASELVSPAWVRKGDCQYTLGAQDGKRYQESIDSYRVVANSKTADPDLGIESRFKIGRSLEKLGRTKEALEQYYLKVIIPYLEECEKEIHHSEAAKLWFTKAVFNAADLLEKEGDWKGSVNILKRAGDSDVPAAGEAKERMDRIRKEHRWVF